MANKTTRWILSEQSLLFHPATSNAGLELIEWPSHHVLTLLIGGKLFLAPLETDKIQVGSRFPVIDTTYPHFATHF